MMKRCLGYLDFLVSLARLDFLVLLGFLGLLGCSTVTQEERVALAARGYYQHLLQGQYEEFLQGRVGADSLPEDYREQLLTSYSQFMAQQRRDHQGVVDVRISSVRTDSLSGSVYVMLFLCYGDSIDEEIVVPMVEHDGIWKMK